MGSPVLRSGTLGIYHRVSISEISASEQLSKTSDLGTGHAVVKMAMELRVYLQTALQGCGLDRSTMQHAYGNGCEVWRLLQERLKPHTATKALAELKDIELHTNLYLGEDFASRLPSMKA